MNAEYHPNWVAELKSLNVDTLRLGEGAFGYSGINIWAHPNTWAQRLDYILNLFASNGFKVWFAQMDSFGGGSEVKGYWYDNDPLYFNDMQVGQSGRAPYLDVDRAKYIIDQLRNGYVSASDPHHNFLTDSRITHWAVGAESDITDTGPNTPRDSLLQICDYMRSQGAKTSACAWLFNDHVGAWDDRNERVVPVASGHADILELHMYGLSALIGPISNKPNGPFDYAKGNPYVYGGCDYYWEDISPRTGNSWKQMLTDYFNEKYTYAGGFTNKMLVSEFGIEYLQGSESDSWGMYVNAQNRKDYFRIYYEVTKQFPLMYVNSLAAISDSRAPYYGLIDPNGNWYPGAAEVASAYSGGGEDISLPFHDSFTTIDPKWQKISGNWT